MNVTLQVGCLYNCDTIMEEPRPFDPIWRQTTVGCRVISLLQEIHHFNITYKSIRYEGNVTSVDGPGKLLALADSNAIDLYANPMALNTAVLDDLYPLGAIFTWRLGFLLQRIETIIFSRFYSKPFSKPAWNGLYMMAAVVTIILYAMKWWEKRHLGGWECSLVHEMLMVIGAYCQHIPPLDAVAWSRRMAYFIFFMYAFVIYTYYASNLLSHLVNDKDHILDLKALASSDYDCVIVDNIKFALEESIQRYGKNISVIIKKLVMLKSVTAADGLEAVKDGRTALLSDFSTLYPIIKQVLDNEDICKLIQIDLFSNIKKYLYTSKDFAYKEQLKIGLLRARETGVLHRLILADLIAAPLCDPSPHVEAKLVQISIPLTIVVVAYFVCFFILCCEKLYFKRYRVWPYVE